MKSGRALDGTTTESVLDLRGGKTLITHLRCLPVERFECVAQRLEQCDLVTLARFTLPPHALVHHVVAALHHVLLSLSLVHETNSGLLGVPPWPLLRLDVLTHIEAIWRKMETRLAKLRRPFNDPCRKPLANAQVLFVVEHVLRTPLLSSLENWEEILDAVRRVSATAESIAAYVLLCVHYSLVSPLSVKGSLAKPPLACVIPRSPVRQQTIESLVTIVPDPMPTEREMTHRSWRCGIKHHGRFFLFHAIVTGSSGGSGRLSAFAIECRNTAFQWDDNVSAVAGPRNPSNAYAGSWIKRVPMPTLIASRIMDYERKSRALSSATTLSLLLQTSVASELFRRPLYGPISRSKCRLPFTCDEADVCVSIHLLVFTVATADVAKQTAALRLVAIGAIGMRGLEAPLSDLRKQLVASDHPHAAFHVHLSSSSFRFFAGGILVPIEDESWRRTIELLPCAFVCLLGESPPPQRRISKPGTSNPKHWRPWLSTLSHISHVVGSTLAKHLQSPHPQASVALASPLGVSLYSLDQTVSSSPCISSTALSTIDTLLTLFVDWSAFVQFQQLQDSSTILHDHVYPHKPRLPPYPRPIMSETENLRPEPTAAELEILFLPHHPFHLEGEYLKPLYATFTSRTRHKAYLCSPYLAELMAALHAASKTNPIRLAVENDECVIHITSVSCRHDHPGRFVVRFTRDRSCPLEMLMTMRDAYVWILTALPDRSVERETEADSESTAPPRWLRDVLRFVVHPTWDFGPQTNERKPPSAWPFPSRFFHIDVPYFEMEQIVEATHWSRGMDWRPHWRACDVERDLLRPKYDALRVSYPSSVAIDSVKFSKWLRECGLQPAYLTVGDAAFLFAAHRAAGSHYEMDYRGFVDAMQWIARRVRPPSTIERGRDALDPQQQQQLTLHAFCFAWLLHAPSMEAIWKRVVNNWRLVEKLRYMEKAALEYCAATRIRANWKRFITRRALIVTLTQLKNERRTAAKLQSLYKMRNVRKYYLRVRACVLRTQRFLRARRELRCLRLKRAQLVETMRRLLQRWMRKRLRVLRCWNAIHGAWLARRARIREKRGRLIWAAAYQLDSRLYRASLYRVPPLPLVPDQNPQSEEEVEFELELLEPLTSCCRSIRVSRRTLDMLDHEARNFQSARKPAAAHGRQKHRSKLLGLMQRLHLKTSRPCITDRHQRTRRLASSACRDYTVTIHRNPMDTSLGRLVFQGNVQVHSFYASSASPTSQFVRLHLRAHDFSLVTYSPTSSTKHRYAFTTVFAYRLFQVAHYHARAEGNDEGKDDEVVARSYVVDALSINPKKLLAMRLLLRYLVCHGITPPTRDLMPEVLERRAREQRERDEYINETRVQRQLTLIVLVQSAARRVLAIRHVQRVAQRSYTKVFDPSRGMLVYTHCRIRDVVTYLEKPRSLRDQDVRDPIDEWISWDEPGSPQTTYFNPFRGIFSRWNNVEAALRVQRWFRRAMWTRGFPTWDLRSLTLALVFHHRVKVPSDVTDLSHVESITEYAYQRHVLHHDYKTASTHYEAALKLDPDHVPALVGLAVLLIYSCRYPVKQTWPRSLELLDRAKQIDPCLATSLTDMEQNCFRWAMFLHPSNANVLGNYAVFRQCVRGDFDHAELLYRRAIDLEAANENVVENYLRLQRERTPEGIYSKAGPSKIAVWRAQEIRRLPNSDWRELEDSSARVPSAMRFFQNVKTGVCTWTLANAALVVE